MKGLVYFFGLSLLAPVWAGGDVGSGPADGEPTREEYNAILNELRDREARALLKISRLKQESADLKEAIRREKQNAQKTWGEILGAIGRTQQQYDDYVRSLEKLRKRIQSPAMGKSAPGDITKLQNEIMELKRNKLALIPSLEQVVFELETQVAMREASPGEAVVGHEETDRVAAKDQTQPPAPNFQKRPSQSEDSKSEEKPEPGNSPEKKSVKAVAVAPSATKTGDAGVKKAAVKHKKAVVLSAAPSSAGEKATRAGGRPGSVEAAAPERKKENNPPEPAGTPAEIASKPKFPEVEVPPDLSSRLYRVKPGETLWKIARAVDPAGEKYNWIFLYALNASQIEDPHHIYAGQIIKIPKGEQ